MKAHQNDSIYLQMGMAALLPGMQYILERMQNELDDFRRQLGLLQNGAPLVEKPAKRRPGQHGRLPLAKGKRLNSRGEPLKAGFWSTLTPKERSAEMKRRKQKAAAEKARERKSAALSRARKEKWATMSPAQQKAHLAKMAAGRAAKQTPVKMAVAS